MLGTPDISIAMATYKGVKYIPEQLESLISQTLQPREVIISDDGSTDGTLEAINTFRHRLNIKVYTNLQPLGVVKNFARAISLCQSRYVALCDQDDVWSSQKLSLNLKKMIEIETDDTLPALVFSDLEIVDENLKTINPSFWQHLNARPQHDTFSELLFGNIVTGCSMMINKSMAEQLARIPSKVVMHDYWAALIAYGFGQVGIIETPLVKYRQHTKNVTNNYARSIRNRAATFFNTLLKDRVNFLRDEIAQAVEFEKLYANSLVLEKRNILLDFIRLSDAGFLTRKWESFKSNHR